MVESLPRYPRVDPVSHVKHPGDGFYKYVNEKWLTTNHIDPWRSENGSFVEIDNKNTSELVALLDKLPLHINSPPKTCKEHLSALRNVWNSRSIPAEHIYLKLCLDQVIRSNEYNSANFFGWLSYSRIPSIINLVIQAETKPPYFVRASLTPGGLTLPIQYYKTAKLQQSPVWKAYEKYINVCAIELGLPFLPRVIDAELELSKIVEAPFKKFTRSIKGSNLKGWMDFEWDAYMDGLQVDAWKTRSWVLDSPERLKQILHWMSTTHKENVLALLAYHLILAASPFLCPAIKDAADVLFRKELLGIYRAIPSKEQFLQVAKEVLPEAICSLYATITKDNSVKRDITQLARSLQKIAVDIMSSTRMLSKTGRSKAVEKIHRMTVQVGGFSTSPDIKGVYYPESMIHTFISNNQAMIKPMMDYIGKPTTTSTPYPCFIVNASYYLESNRIVIPWGILHWPFYHSNAPLGWNYGGIGNTIGHEITHAFDLEGSKYSPRAVYKESWTRKNRQTFVKRTRKVSKFYSDFTRYGIHLNGKRTISEDWADLGAMNITLNALKADLDDIGASADVRKEAYRTYFIAYAVSFRKLVKKQTTIFQILTDVHTPAEDRVDRIVPHFQEWVEAFDIKDTDSLYIPKEKRLTFF